MRRGSPLCCFNLAMVVMDSDDIVVERMADAEWLREYRVWMYRGAWAEWDIADKRFVTSLVRASSSSRSSNSPTGRWRISFRNSATGRCNFDASVV